MNRRGDIAVTVLVLMTVFLTGFALFSFYTHYGKIEAYISDARFIESASFQERQIEFYLNDFSERAVLDSYSDLAANGQFTGTGVSKQNSVVVLNDFDKFTSDAALRGGIIEGIKRIAGEYNFGSVSLDDFKNSLTAGKFNVGVLGDNVNISLEGVPIYVNIVKKDYERIYIGNIPGIGRVIPTLKTKEKIVSSIGIVYTPKFSLIINLESLGLEGYDKINVAAVSCKNNANNNAIQGCFNSELKNFDTAVSDVGNLKKVSLNSKRVFVLNGQLKKIGFEFILG